METWNQLADRARQWWRTSPPGSRIAAAALLAVLVGASAWFAQRGLGDTHVYLLGGYAFAPEDMPAVQAALGKAQLGDFVVEDNRIRIPQDRQAAYLAALADGNALPETLPDIYADMAARSSPLASRQQQDEHARIAKRRGLALILRSMHDVESAEVDFDREESRGLRPQRTATALVALRLRGGRALDEDRVPHFQRVVAAAIAGLSPGEVVVIDKNTGVSYGGRRAADGGTLDDPYRDLKRKYQADYESMIRRALAYVPGVSVTADVELDRELRHEERRVTLYSDRDATGSSLGGALANPGDRRSVASVAANGPESLAAESSRNTGSELGDNVATALLGRGNPSSRDRTNAPAVQNETTTQVAGLTPKRVAISIGVPTSYFEGVWRQRFGAASAEAPSEATMAAQRARVQAEEIARIERHVANLISLPDGGNAPAPTVTVTPFVSLATAPETATGPPEPSPAGPGWAWLARWWQAIAALSFALVGLLALRWLGRSNAAGALESGEYGDLAYHTVTGERDKDDASSRIDEGDNLARLVRRDPEAAANVLRAWIGNTSGV